MATGDNNGEGGSRREGQKFRREKMKEVRNNICANGSPTKRGSQEEGRTPALEGSAGGGGDRLLYDATQSTSSTPACRASASSIHAMCVCGEVGVGQVG